MINTLVSVGMSCQTTHQIHLAVDQSTSAAHNISVQKGPFDWLICPLESACHWLDSGLESFEPEAIVDERDHAFWPQFDFWFWHGFYQKSGSLKHLDVAGTMERERSKLTYQREQFSSIDPETTLFVWSNCQNNLSTDVFAENELGRIRLTEQGRNRLQASLDHYFTRTCKLIFVTRTDRADPAVLDFNNVYAVAEEPSEWKGDRKQWQKLLNTAFDQFVCGNSNN
ncbi:MAG: hypothetical protein AAF468_13570 [Pseudomonadota bacterium]